ncbi:unnamed protein product [Acanthocheilonema viteae]|uniref:Uncharacterized protein n=1 Tax=Acanthocheilonema viteae TaxID=6277 RepID=A0A498SPP2_ACAVI|nr:unnamed protein product [Acanthocheilonema viteae]
MKKADSTTTSLPYKSSPEAKVKREDEQTAKTVLSEVSINMESPCGSLAVRKSDVQNEGIDNVIKKPEKSNEQENICTTMKIPEVELCNIHIDQSKSCDVTPIRRRTDMEGYLRDDRKDLLSETRKSTDIDRSSQKTKKKKAFEENAKHTAQRENDCQGCKIAERELKILAAQLKELEREVKSKLKIKTSGPEIFSKKEELKKKIEELENEIAIQRSQYEKELEKNCREKERLKIELLKVEEKISILEKETERKKKECDQYVFTIVDMRNNFKKRLREKENDVRRWTEINEKIKEQLYQSSKSMTRRYEIMLKESCEDNLKLYIHLQKVTKILESKDFQTLQSEIFHQQLRKKMSELLQKFKNEVNSTNFKWLSEEDARRVVGYFEVIVETILHKKPSFHFFVDRLTVFIEEKILSEQSQSCAGGRSMKESVKGQESKTFKMFKEKFREKIHSMLKEFMEKQQRNLSENMSTILSHVENANQRIDLINTDLINHVENMNDIITAIDNKQRHLQKIEEVLDYGSALMKKFLDRRNIPTLNFDEEKSKLRESCISLTDGYMKLKKKVEKLEKMQEELSSASKQRMNQSMGVRTPNDEWRHKVTRRFSSSPYERKRHHEGITRRRATEGMWKDMRNE